MLDDINYLKSVNEKLGLDNKELTASLNEANEIIDAIKKGNIDSIFISKNEIAKDLVSKIADHTYKTFIDNMSEGVVTLNLNGIIIYSNASFAKMVNLPLERIVGNDFLTFIPVEYVNSFESFFNEHPDNNSKIALSMIDARGIRFHFVVSFNKLHLNNFQALNLVMTDITFQKYAEEKLKVVNGNLRVAIDKRQSSEKKVVLLNKKLKDNIKTLEDTNGELATFAYIASHDLQEPLRKISTYTGLLKRRFYNIIDQEGKEYIHTIQTSSERMRKLIRDILEYVGLSRENLFLPVELQSIVNELLSDLEIVINEAKATITIEKQLPRIEANAGQIKQLLQNILSNALKFIKPNVSPVITIDYKIVSGSEIDNMIESRFNEKFCLIYIKDNGIGFDPVYLDKIFVIFQRLNGNAAYNGTGIGLAICKKIVEQHNGYITANSNLGNGSLFTVTLPVSQHSKRD